MTNSMPEGKSGRSLEEVAEMESGIPAKKAKGTPKAKPKGTPKVPPRPPQQKRLRQRQRKNKLVRLSKTLQTSR